MLLGQLPSFTYGPEIRSVNCTNTHKFDTQTSWLSQRGRKNKKVGTVWRNTCHDRASALGLLTETEFQNLMGRNHLKPNINYLGLWVRWFQMVGCIWPVGSGLSTPAPGICHDILSWWSDQWTRKWHNPSPLPWWWCLEPHSGHTRSFPEAWRGWTQPLWVLESPSKAF